MKDIKIFITDIDGVWTDGSMYYSEEGYVLKKFHTYDSAGVLFLKLLNIPLAIVSGENSEVVVKRAEKLGIKNVYIGIKDKVAKVEKLLQVYHISWNEVAYIGDDINDLKLFKKVGLSACPVSAPDYIQNKVDWVLTKKGGAGVFREFVEKYLKEKQMLDLALQKYLKAE